MKRRERKLRCESLWKEYLRYSGWLKIAIPPSPAILPHLEELELAAKDAAAEAEALGERVICYGPQMRCLAVRYERCYPAPISTAELQLNSILEKMNVDPY